MEKTSLHRPRINIFIGAYGSGKTEVAVNYALRLKKQEQNVGLVDLDIVNPYFRSRELRVFFQNHGIEVVSSSTGLEEADLPALSPKIFSLLQNTDYQAIFDVGGDPVGARALGRYHEYFSKEPYNLWLVVNPYRPGSSTPNELFELAQSLESASKLKITGIVDNANLGKETTRQIREEGARVVEEAAQLLSLPVVMRTIVPAVNIGQFTPVNNGPEVIELQLYMLPPWENTSR